MTYRLTYTDGRIFGDIWGKDARARAFALAARVGGLVVTPVSAFA